MNRPTLLLVLGMPGSGKTTLAKKLSRELNLLLVVKDDLKVVLLDAYGWKDRETSMQAGGASYKLMDYIIAEQLRVVTHSLWRVPLIQNMMMQGSSPGRKHTASVTSRYIAMQMPTSYVSASKNELLLTIATSVMQKAKRACRT